MSVDYRVFWQNSTEIWQQSKTFGKDYNGALKLWDEILTNMGHPYQLSDGTPTDAYASDLKVNPYKNTTAVFFEDWGTTRTRFGDTNTGVMPPSLEPPSYVGSFYISSGSETESMKDFYFKARGNNSAFKIFDDYVVMYPTMNHSLHSVTDTANTTVRQYYAPGPITDGTGQVVGETQGYTETVNNVVETGPGYQVTDTPPVTETAKPTDWGGIALFLLGLGLAGVILWYLWKHRAKVKAVAVKVVEAPVKIAEKIVGASPKKEVI